MGCAAFRIDTMARMRCCLCVMTTLRRCVLHMLHQGLERTMQQCRIPDCAGGSIHGSGGPSRWSRRQLEGNTFLPPYRCVSLAKLQEEQRL